MGCVWDEDHPAFLRYEGERAAQAASRKRSLESLLNGDDDDDDDCFAFGAGNREGSDDGDADGSYRGGGL